MNSASLQNRLPKTENSPGESSSRTGCRHAYAGIARPSLERSSVPNPNPRPTSALVEPGRVQLILQRLRSDFYEVPPASERIAVSVLTELNQAKKDPSALPH
jgi:hypothetical protein